MSEPSPVRYCHGCAAYDDHPRVFHVADQDDPARDKLYHYDCAPADVVTPVLEPIVAVVRGGRKLKGDGLAAFATDYAQSLDEAPADDTSTEKG